MTWNGGRWCVILSQKRLVMGCSLPTRRGSVLGYGAKSVVKDGSYAVLLQMPRLQSGATNHTLKYGHLTKYYMRDIILEFVYKQVLMWMDNIYRKMFYL